METNQQKPEFENGIRIIRDLDAEPPARAAALRAAMQEMYEEAQAELAETD